ncbi:diaminopimelate epimerase [Chromobacterium vaccinii]|uniref:diaminopimelate epimerase n=1 Tax=Chromobacterium piscinae TaxID=686831 RepID=UPI0014075B14|nr:diaminopimelate epimerase [Chromobacterium vaccinii]MBX9346455.1 diaminopimelate epimerase [Chromobacterium vaccinii]MBX9355621.1 diaminopimelate epimerase [Chromobacterium vaccinii]NHQ82833.1 diaminopimelate epimerase [Chromobacterium vaccinii]
MKLKFSKMHGLGNDFMVIDGVRQAVSLSPEQIRLLGNRQLGIGFDQLLLVEPAREAGHDFRYRIFNNDGGEVEQCGNGARCFAKFVRDQGLTGKSRIEVETARGVISPEYLGDGLARVDMGVPRFKPADLPFLADAEALTYALPLSGGGCEIGIASMGNPHAVQLVDDVDTAPVAEIGPRIESHPAFPQRVNAGFMQIVNRGEIRLRVYERGAGETLACGTGACAAVVCGIRQGLLDPRVTVHARGGDIVIEWAGEGSPVIMTGPAVTVFQGEIEL